MSVCPLAFQARQILYAHQRGERPPTPLYNEAFSRVADARHERRELRLRLRHPYPLRHIYPQSTEQVILTILAPAFAGPATVPDGGEIRRMGPELPPPLGWEHIALTGVYRWDLEGARNGRLRPLRS